MKLRRFILFTFIICLYITAKGNDNKIKSDTNSTKKCFYEFGIGGAMIGPYGDAVFGLNCTKKTSVSMQLSAAWEMFSGWPIYGFLKYPLNYYVSPAILYNINMNHFKIGAGFSFSEGRERTKDVIGEEFGLLVANDYFRYYKYEVMGVRLNAQYILLYRKKHHIGINMFIDYNPQIIQFGAYLNLMKK